MPTSACDYSDSSKTNLGRLGFTISVASLRRFVDFVVADRRQGDHFTATGGVDPAFRFHGTPTSLFYTLSLHDALPICCTSNRDQFVSRAADCDGAKVLGLIGYAYSRAPSGM